MFFGIGGVLALALARWPSRAATVVAGVILSLTLVRFLQSGARTSFSLKTMLLVTGLVASGSVLKMLGAPWKEVHLIPGDGVNVAISHDGKLVAASQGTSIEIRDTQTGRSVQTIKMTAAEATQKANQKWVFKMGFTMNGKSLMTVDWQTYPCLFDVATGNELRGWSTQGMSALAASGNRFITDSVNASRTVKHCNVYDVDSNQPILKVETNFHYCRNISPTGSHVLVGKDRTTAELWSVDEKRLVGTIPIPQTDSGLVIFFVKFTRDGNLLAVPTATGVAVWDVTQCQKIAEWKPQKFDHIGSLEWSPDGSRMVASYIQFIGPSGPAVAAAAMAGTSVRNAVEHSYLLDQNCREIAPIIGTSATFSPSGDRIATVHGFLNILDGRTGDLLTSVAARPRETTLGNAAIYFSPDGNWLLVNGSPAVFRRTRSEFWYSIYQLPAFWGTVLFLTAIIVQLSESIHVGRLAHSRLIPRNIDVVRI